MSIGERQEDRNTRPRPASGGRHRPKSTGAAGPSGRFASEGIRSHRLRLRRPRASRGPRAGQLAATTLAEQEEGIPGITRGEPDRVGVDPEGPFHAELLDRPAGRRRTRPATKSSVAPTWTETGTPSSSRCSVEPEFPLGLAQRDHQEVGPGLADPGDQRVGSPRRRASRGAGRRSRRRSAPDRATWSRRAASSATPSAPPSR